MLQHVSDHKRSIIVSLVQCLAKNYKNGSIVSVDMDAAGVMAAYSDPLYMCIVHCIGKAQSAFLQSERYTYTTGQNMLP